ncbi:unnamed protein product [Lupinus luteus]|uniref:CCHC-type domain-containing protein n=1 Tax=Lupinus luteus TaxID=3873 RepID=A0AAV1WKU7_LUPLU
MANPPPPKVKRDLIAQNLMTAEFENDNPLLPCVTIHESVVEELCSSLRDALVVTLLGKRMGYVALRERLQRLWKLQGDFEMVDVDNGFYMIKFDLPADKEMVTSKGPWMIFDHYLAMANWTPDFISPTAKVDRTMVWIRFPGLNMVYYDESVLLGLASFIGKPIKVDTNTLTATRGRYARVCVEIDLNKPVVGKIKINHWHKIMYEGLHLLCSSCGHYGHVTRNCLQHTKTNAEKTHPHQHGDIAPDTVSHVDVHELNAINAPVHDSMEKTADFIHSLNDINEDCNHSNNITETHGDWLMVVRKKRNGKRGGGVQKRPEFMPNNNPFNALADDKKESHGFSKHSGSFNVIQSSMHDIIAPIIGTSTPNGQNNKRSRATLNVPLNTRNMHVNTNPTLPNVSKPSSLNPKHTSHNITLQDPTMHTHALLCTSNACTLIQSHVHKPNNHVSPQSPHNANNHVSPLVEIPLPANQTIKPLSSSLDLSLCPNNNMAYGDSNGQVMQIDYSDSDQHGLMEDTGGSH